MEINVVIRPRTLQRMFHDLVAEIRRRVETPLPCDRAGSLAVTP